MPDLTESMAGSTAGQEASSGNGANGASLVDRKSLLLRRGTEQRTNEQGKPLDGTQPKEVSTRPVQEPLENFANNLMHQLLELQKTQPRVYGVIINDPGRPYLKELVTQFTQEKRDGTGREINSAAVKEVLATDKGLQSLIVILEEDQDLMNAGQARYARKAEAWTIPKALAKQQKLARFFNSRPTSQDRMVLEKSQGAHEFAMTPNERNYLKAVYGVDVQDAASGEYKTAVTRTKGGWELQEAAKQAYAMREQYYQDTLGIPADQINGSSIAWILTFAQKHNSGRPQPEHMGAIDERILEKFEPNIGIIDRNGNTPMVLTGGRLVENPNFKWNNLDLPQTLANYAAARRAVITELFQETVKELTEKKANPKPDIAALQTKAENWTDADQAERVRVAGEMQTKLQQERDLLAAGTVHDEAFEQKDKELQSAARELEDALGGSTEIRSSTSDTDAEAAVNAEKAKIDTDVEAALHKAGPSGRTPLEDVSHWTDEYNNIYDTTYAAAIGRMVAPMVKGKPGDHTEDQKNRAAQAARAKADASSQALELSRAKRAIETIEQPKQKGAQLDQLLARFKKLKQERNDPENKALSSHTVKSSETEAAFTDLTTKGLDADDLSGELKSVDELLTEAIDVHNYFAGAVPTNEQIEKLRDDIVLARAEGRARAEEGWNSVPSENAMQFTEITGGKGLNTGATPITENELVRLSVTELLKRLSTDYAGWTTSHADELRLIKARSVAQRRLITRTKFYRGEKIKDLDDQTRKLQEVIDAESTDKTKTRLQRTYKIAEQFANGKTMTEYQVVTSDPGRFTDDKPIDASDPTYSDAEKNITGAPKGYFEMLKLFGYDRNATDRDQQLEEFQLVLPPQKMAELFNEYLNLRTRRPIDAPKVFRKLHRSMTATPPTISAEALGVGIMDMVEALYKEGMAIK